MKFALFTHLPWPEGTDPKRIFEQATEEVQYGEELGFHSAWLAEHHFSRYGLGSSSLVLAASMAAQTKTIRLGTAVLVPPLHHPVRLAEDADTVDSISGAAWTWVLGGAPGATSIPASMWTGRRARSGSRRPLL